MVPAAEYVPRIQTLENMLVRTSERKRELPFRERRKPPKAIIEDLSLFMSAGLAASFAVTIRLGGPAKQQQLFHSPEEVVDEFLDCVRLFTEERGEELRSGLLMKHISETSCIKHGRSHPMVSESAPWASPWKTHKLSYTVHHAPTGSLARRLQRIGQCPSSAN